MLYVCVMAPERVVMLSYWRQGNSQQPATTGQWLVWAVAEINQHFSISVLTEKGGGMEDAAVTVEQVE